MKCPKCKYTSFDFNERCPNCNRDLSSERKVFDLIAFKHNPPYLLGSLTADFRDSGLPLDAGKWSIETDTDSQDLDLHLDLDKEELHDAMPEEEFTLDQEDLDDLEGEIVVPEANAVEALGSDDISLNDTILDLPADQGLDQPGSSEMLTTEIAFEELRLSEDQGV